MSINDKKERDYYERYAKEDCLTVSKLKYAINHRFYDRLLKTQLEQLIEEGKLDKDKNKEEKQFEFITNPQIYDFLGLDKDKPYSEKDLESCIISQLTEFMLTMGRGYAFVDRQKLIRTELADYYIDLIFYNYMLKRFVLVDLKTEKITYQDVGQMDMYIQLFDKYEKGEDDNPTLGMIVTSQTDADIAQYLILNENKQLFMVEYREYLPSQEKLKALIETQKTMFYLKQSEEKKDSETIYKENDLSFTEESVFNLIKENNKITNSELVSKLSKSGPTVHRAIFSLITKGYIKVEGKSQNRIFVILKK